MDIQYQMTETEALQSLLKIRRRFSRFRWLRFGAAMAGTSMLTLFLLDPWHYTDTPLWFACLLACAVSAIIVLLYQRHSHGVLIKFVRTNAAIYTAPYAVSYNENGLTFSSPTTKQESVWAVYTHRYDDDQIICLYSRLSGMLAVIPKRAFDDTGFAEFRRCSQSLQQA